MRKITRFVGMDVHAETIAVAVAEGREGAARSLGRSAIVRRLSDDCWESWAIQRS
jgi:hypothetical protein